VRGQRLHLGVGVDRQDRRPVGAERVVPRAADGLGITHGDALKTDGRLPALAHKAGAR
jgi:hypothetical protein